MNYKQKRIMSCFVLYKEYGWHLYKIKVKTHYVIFAVKDKLDLENLDTGINVYQEGEYSSESVYDILNGLCHKVTIFPPQTFNIDILDENPESVFEGVDINSEDFKQVYDTWKNYWKLTSEFIDRKEDIRYSFVKLSDNEYKFDKKEVKQE